MDQLIDNLARAIALQISRRDAVKLLFGAALGFGALRTVAAQAPYTCGDNVRTGSPVGNCNAACSGPGNQPNTTGDCPAQCPSKTVIATAGDSTCPGQPPRGCFSKCPSDPSQACISSTVRCRCGTSVCGVDQCCCVQTLTCLSSTNANGGACGSGTGCGA